MTTKDSQDPLAAELEALERELAEAEEQHIRLSARISGLRAQRDALGNALSARHATAVATGALSAPVDLGSVRKRTEAITVLLEHASRPMTIEEVQQALNDSWSVTPSTYAVTASTLNMLEKGNRIVRVGRGRYAAIGKPSGAPTANNA